MIQAIREWWADSGLKSIYEIYINPDERHEEAEAQYRQNLRRLERLVFIQVFVLLSIFLLLFIPIDMLVFKGEVQKTYIQFRLFAVFVIMLGLLGVNVSDVLWRYSTEWFVSCSGLAGFIILYLIGGLSVDTFPIEQKIAAFSSVLIVPGLTAFFISLDIKQRIITNAYFAFCLFSGYFILRPKNLSIGHDPLYMLVVGYLSAMVLSILGGHLVKNLYRRSYFLQQDLEDQRNKAQHEYERAENLLLNILPESVADKLKGDRSEMIAEGYDETTVLFCDLVEFTPLAENLRPTSVVRLLDDIISSFDQIVEKYPVEKIKTIGDEYFVTAGVPKEIDNHAVVASNLALEMMEVVQKYERSSENNFEARIGLNTGPVVAGVIGTDKFVYDVWGSTVNVGSRMESQGEPGKIQVTPATKEAIEEQDDEGRFTFEDRGSIQVKGKGEMRTYFLQRSNWE